MNEAERGIAAYKATAAKQSGKGKKPKKGGRPLQSSGNGEVEVEISRPKASTGENRATADKSGRTAGQKPAQATGEVPAAALNASRREGNLSGRTETLLRKATRNKGYRRVAKFLLLLGKEEAAEILKHLDKSEAEEISLEIARIKQIDDVEAQTLLAEFGAAGRVAGENKAGPETARSMLVAAFGESRADQILRRVVPESQAKPFQFLTELDHEQIVLLLKNESAPAISIVLPYLPPAKASKVLSVLSPQLQREVIRRIARMKSVDPEVIVRIEGVLQERLRTQGRVITEEIDGREALANILRHLDYSLEEKILEDLSSADPAISENVRERLFTIDLIFKIDDQELQAVLRDFEDSEIAVILKAKPEEVQERLLTNLSSRRREIVKEEMLLLGKMRRSDVDSATKDFVDYLVDLDLQRKITIHWNDPVVE